MEPVIPAVDLVAKLLGDQQAKELLHHASHADEVGRDKTATPLQSCPAKLNQAAEVVDGQPPPIPNPNGIVPGGPWTPAGAGQKDGTYFGPKQASGGRSTTRWVPSHDEGGPPGSRGYWKTKTPDTPWTRYDQQGSPVTPEEAHPNPAPPTESTPQTPDTPEIPEVPDIPDFPLL